MPWFTFNLLQVFDERYAILELCLNGTEPTLGLHLHDLRLLLDQGSASVTDSETIEEVSKKGEIKFGIWAVTEI